MLTSLLVYNSFSDISKENIHFKIYILEGEGFASWPEVFLIDQNGANSCFSQDEDIKGEALISVTLRRLKMFKYNTDFITKN